MSRFRQASEMTANQIKQGTKKGLNYLGDTDPKRVFKIVGVLMGLVLLITIFWGFFKKIAEFLGLATSQEQRDEKDRQEQENLEQEKGQFDQDTSDYNPLTPDGTSKNTYGKLGSTWEDPSKHIGLYWDNKAKKWYPNKERKKGIEALIDDIYLKTKAFNWLYYPEVINRLVNINLTSLKYAVYLWDKKYNSTKKLGLGKMLDSEYHSGNYDPAIERLKKNKIFW